jgi:hypothetical protein
MFVYKFFGLRSASAQRTLAMTNRLRKRPIAQAAASPVGFALILFVWIAQRIALRTRARAVARMRIPILQVLF